MVKAVEVCLSTVAASKRTGTLAALLCLQLFSFVESRRLVQSRVPGSLLAARHLGADSILGLI